MRNEYSAGIARPSPPASAPRGLGSPYVEAAQHDEQRYRAESQLVARRSTARRERDDRRTP